MALQSLDVIRRSAATTPPPQVRGALEVAKLIDVSKCIGCKACQAACMEWNDLRDEPQPLLGSLTSPYDLTDRSWTVMRFYEEELPSHGLQWLIVKDGCMHCADPGCLRACPAPGALVQYANGIVDFQEENCIGCGYCQTACPFNIPRFSLKDNKAYKCTLCSDRVAVGLEPACIKTCPTQVMYVLPHGDPELYRLPKDPRVSPLVALWRSGVAKTLGVVTMFAVVVAGIFHYMKVGPLEVPEDEKGGHS